jgi:phage-related protein
MGDRGSERSAEDESDVRWRMGGLAEQLTASGLQATVHETHHVFDITATLQQPERKDVDVVIDEDGYTEVRYWADPAASPEETVAVIVRTLAVITGTELAQPKRRPST